MHKVKFDTQIITKSEIFKYPGSLIQGNGEIYDDVILMRADQSRTPSSKNASGKMRMLRWMCRHTRNERIWNEFEHVKSKCANALVKRLDIRGLIKIEDIPHLQFNYRGHDLIYEDMKVVNKGR
ncbi:hypothetical protein H5410_025702, partial [Solanum commersonii]